jgi:NADH dehydrogenase [ubiquinone] 1 alpha subcomplex assembly factor 7
MTRLAERLRARIRSQGPMPVGDYMAAALSEPEEGYYMRRDPLGAGGDFVTAPEISQAFGELIGLWCAVVWRAAGAPSPVRLVELGPGRGTLIADLLRAAAADREFAAAIELHLVETSPVLRGAQRKRVAAHRVAWHDALDTVPEGPLLVVANEFFDALPVEQYVRTERGWSPRVVDVARDGSRLVLRPGDAVASSLVVPPALAEAPAGAVFEAAPRRDALARSLAARVVRGGGAALIVDYGYARGGAGDTLQGVARHGYADVVAAPGEVDLTAHVDFAALAKAGEAAGARVFGPVPHGEFLIRLGLSYRVARLTASAPDGAAAGAVRAGARRLVDPAGMGLLFKAMAFAHPLLAMPPGFASNSSEDTSIP